MYPLRVVGRFSKRWLIVMLLVGNGCANPDRTWTFRTETPPPFSTDGEIVAPDRWWTSFNDIQLNARVDQAMSGNFTLAAALQRLYAARALTRREASDLWPDLNGVADYGATMGPGDDRSSFIWGLDAGYQVDLWGEIESRVDAERLRTSATREDYHAIALTLSAEISRTWFSLIEAHAQVALLDEQIDSNEMGLALQEARFASGLILSPDVLRQRQLLEATLEQRVIVKSRIAVLEHQLAVLLGEMPQAAEYDPGTELPGLPPLPATGLPSELLQRRPDVRRDYLAFRAADRDLASAISAQYPRINLSGSLLNVSESPETIFRDWFVSIGASMIAPLFDGGQRRAEVDRTAAVKRELFNFYGQTMLEAFGEVEDALAQERYQLERIEHLENQVELARQSSEQLREQYLIGDADYLDVLSAITGQQRLQRETLSAQLDLVLIRVSLYLALAGGFDTRPQDFELLESTVEIVSETVVDE
ncbi:TolC family protein [Rhodopirellula sp. JC740]|uniref:TolC family protein n=1 Tax=Rhodopirellula halodulae TaxID=2894198 RepID=A0ABS8NHI7_9BACT|nr:MULTISPECIES: TolC family protein [unclassified Rhodopirellula]MCC9642864.1 TolC family protein [Rhodopirellula sp. JC740]MCC9656239.1 TolC family protein [Rhodopirellula sp. JC737]